ncbi:hypothetical protein, partial [Escherichia coli]|uniref:hypothetical protein n=1 Tax=Escherichia coli TaxID=562 RepID=UPI001A7E1060
VSIKNDGHYFCRAGGNRPDGLNEPVTDVGVVFCFLLVNMTGRKPCRGATLFAAYQHFLTSSLLSF